MRTQHLNEWASPIVGLWHPSGSVFDLAQILLILFGVYSLAGLVIAIFFVARGLGVVDPVAVGASWGVRLVLLPGLVALWPAIVILWSRRRAGALAEHSR